MRLDLVGDEACPTLGRERREERGLAAGAGAQVEPARVVADGAGLRSGERCGGERERDELAALVLDAGAAVAHGAERGGSPPSRVSAVGAQRAG